ncbi:MAG: class I SAM-dependent methyltransferase [Euryarchaeota archaeon]|nr:class I SAM-dependent methyltransferase [Euryarchaeota archaeon]
MNKKRFYDLLAEKYNEQYSDTLNRKMRNEEKKLLLKCLKEGNVLDVGCGLGYHSQFLREHGFEVYGMDISKNMIAQGLQQGTVAEASALPYRSSSFDNVISIFGALNHTDIPKFAKELERVLRPEGQFVITAANALCFKRIMKMGVKKKGRVLLRKNGKMYSTKLKYYTYKEIKDAFENFDMKIGSLYPKAIFLPFFRKYGYYLAVYGRKN